MSKIQFYIPNPKDEQLINVNYSKLLMLHQEIADFSQGTQGATWSDGVSQLVARILWGGVKADFDDAYLYPGYTSDEIYGILRKINELAEELKWYPFESNNIDVMTFTPLEEIKNELKI